MYCSSFASLTHPSFSLRCSTTVYGKTIVDLSSTTSTSQLTPSSSRQIPELVHSFDMVVIDPPFIVREVWEKYTKCAKYLLKENDANVRVLGTTVFENAPLMGELFGCKPQAFMPSIPHLVYQYNLYTNYQSDVFDKKNPEIPE